MTWKNFLARSGSEKRKITILGGGGGGVSAAFWLSSTPELREKYDITLYSRGWRLGGKAASGRNADIAERIEEHGLHVMMGCYQNVFHTIRECYGAWNPPADNKFKNWKDAFDPHRSVYMWDDSELGDAGKPDPWFFEFPKIPGDPGEIDGGGVFMLWLHLGRLIKNEILNTEFWDDGPGADVDASSLLSRLDRTFSSIMFDVITFRPTRLFDELQKLLREVEKIIEDEDDELRLLYERMWILIDLGVAIAKGILEDILLKMWRQFPSTSLDQLNEQDFRQWVMSHGASEKSVNAAPLTTIYELAFAYRGGDSSDPEKASMAAGVTLLFSLQLVLDYRDAPIWRMRAGMGDTIFTPMYQVLKDRGVEIKLFHNIKGVVPDAEGTGIEAINLARQADFVNDSYQPFKRVQDLDCWPSEPFWDQLENGAQLKHQGVNFESIWDDTHVEEFKLVRGTDFDLVVLAVPPEMQKLVAPELSAKDDRYKQMIDGSASVRTRSTQLWLSEPLEEIAVYHPLPLMGTLPEPYNTWGDMSDLISAEDWPENERPKNIAYLCATMEELPGVPRHPIKAAHGFAQSSAETWLGKNAGTIWPKGNWASISDMAPSLPDLVQSAYFRGNVEPSELYVQTPAKNVETRLDPGKSNYDNLYLAGDWTRTRYSGGCFESTVESGMLVSKAISGHPKKIQTS